MTRFEDFASKYKIVADSKGARAVFEFLSQPEIIARMIVFSDLGMPALEAVANLLEKGIVGYPDFKFIYIQNRQLVGRMITFILSEFGYVPTGERRKLRKFAKSINFTTGAVYKRNPNIIPKSKIIIVDNKII